MQRVVTGICQQLVGAHHDDRVAVLDRDLEVSEAVLLKKAGLPERRLHQSFGSCLAVLGEEALIKRSGVDADPDGASSVSSGFCDLLDLIIESANVARIDAYGSAPGIDSREDVPGLEVDVGDHRDLGFLGDHWQGVGVVLARYGNSDDVAAGGGQLRSEEHTSELQSRLHLVCRLLLE